PTELGPPELPVPPTDVLSRPVHAAPETGRRLLRLGMTALGAALLVAAVALGLPRLSSSSSVAREPPNAGPSSRPAGGEEGSAATTTVEATSLPPAALAVETDGALQRGMVETTSTAPGTSTTTTVRGPQALLTVRAKPWVQVKVDRHDYGSVQPSRTFRLRPGWHRVEVIGSDGEARVERRLFKAGGPTALGHPNPG